MNGAPIDYCDRCGGDPDAHYPFTRESCPASERFDACVPAGRGFRRPVLATDPKSLHWARIHAVTDALAAHIALARSSHARMESVVAHARMLAGQVRSTPDGNADDYDRYEAAGRPSTARRVLHVLLQVRDP